MTVWKRFRRRKPESVANPSLLPPEELDRLVEEGMMIVSSALRMGAKNHLIVQALTSGDDFDEPALLELLRRDAAALAAEKETEADRLAEIAGRAAKRTGRATFHDDYRRRDVDALTARERLNGAMADRLRALVDDEEGLRALLAAAREQALDDILQSRLLAAAPFHRDPDYRAERPQRIRSLKQDLGVLYRRQKARLGERIE